MPKTRPCPICKQNNYYQSGIFVCKRCKPVLISLHHCHKSSLHADKLVEILIKSLREKHPCPICQGKGHFYAKELCETCYGKGYKIPEDYQPAHQEEGKEE